MPVETASVRRNVFVSWVAHAVTVVVGFFLMPYIVQVLGEHSYGMWVFVNSLASYAGLLYFGFGDTISRYVARYHAAGDQERVNRVVSLVTAVYMVMGCVALTIALGLAATLPWYSGWHGQPLHEMQATIIVLGLNVAVSMVGSVFGGVLMGLRRFDLERSVGFASDALRVALVFVFLQREWGLLTIALIYLGISVFENLCCLVLAYRQMPDLRIGWSYVSRDMLRECTSFSSMAFLNAIAYQLMAAADTVVIGFMFGAESIVPYYIALRLSQFIRQPIEKIAVICMPTAGALSADTEPRRLHQFLAQAVGVVFLLSAGMFVGGCFFGGEVIRLWMGERYVSSQHLLVILLAAQMVALPCGIFRAFLMGLGAVRIPALLYLAEAVLKVVLSVALCSVWGLAGVAWGGLIPVALIELACLVPYALRQLNWPIRRLWLAAIAPQLLPVAALAAYSAVVSGQAWSHAGWPALISITLGGGAVLGAMWLLSHRVVSSRVLGTT
jgi:O-antigen/teichoic acid export membrane protein